MRVALDGRHGSARRGVGRYVRSVVGAWPEGDDLVEVPGSRAAFTSAALLGRPRLDRMAGGPDVVWLPAPGPVAVSRRVPLVLTLHDLSWEQRPQDFTPYERAWHRLARIPALARRADRVVADSRATADAALDLWRLPPERVVVVPPGPGLEGVRHVFTDRPAERAEPPYLLAVGAGPRKALDLLERAHARARAAGLRARLVVAGGGAVSDAELEDLYAGALALVHPAHLEGFGFPPVEALARGVPAIVADLPVYDETVGAGALRFPAGDERMLADALLRIERDEEVRAHLVAAGGEAVARLSWERCARELRAVLAEVVAAGGRGHRPRRRWSMAAVGGHHVEPR